MQSIEETGNRMATALFYVRICDFVIDNFGYKMVPRYSVFWRPGAPFTLIVLKKKRIFGGNIFVLLKKINRPFLNTKVSKFCLIVISW